MDTSISCYPAQATFPDWRESVLVSIFFQMYSSCLIKYTVSYSDPHAMFAHYFEFFFLTDSLSLAVLFLGMFVCIFPALSDTCRSYWMLSMNHNKTIMYIFPAQTVWKNLSTVSFSRFSCFQFSPKFFLFSTQVFFLQVIVLIIFLYEATFGTFCKVRH